MKRGKRQYKDATWRKLFVNHVYQYVVNRNKLENHPHYKLAQRLAYKDALAGTRQHEQRYSDTFYRAGYSATMQRYGQRARQRAIEDYRRSNR